MLFRSSADNVTVYFSYDTGNSWCILRQSADILYYEYPAKYLSVPYRTGNTNVLYIAVDSLCWIYALAAKKQTVR